MRRWTIVLVGIMLLSLCSCRELKDKNRDMELSKLKEQLCSQNSPELQIEMLGENEVNITLNTEAIGILHSDSQEDESELIDEIEITFLSEGEENMINLDIMKNYFNLSGEKSNAGLTYWLYTDGDKEGTRTEKSFSTAIFQMGIAEEFKNCTDYTVRIYSSKLRYQDIILDGKVADILSEKEKVKAPRFSVDFSDSQSIKFNISGEDIKTAFYNNENIELKIYESEEVLKDIYANSIVDFRVLAVDRGENCKMTTCFINDNGKIWDLGGDRDTKIGLAKATESGVAIRYVHERIDEWIKPEYVYQLYIGVDLIETGRLSDGDLEKMYSNISPIPDWVPKNIKDSEFLTPDTGEYTITVLEIPDAEMDAPKWYSEKGNMIYGAIEKKKIHLKVVALDSYDEFGLFSSKYKVIYPSVEEAMYAAAGSKMLIVQAQNNELITDILYDKYDKALFGEMDYFNYRGRYDNVRYYKLTRKGINRRLFEFACDLTTTNTENLHFDFNEVSIKYMEKRSSTQQAAKYSYETYEITTYSTRKKDVRSYEEMKGLYSTAPDHWEDHPFISLLPPIPAGMTLQYRENSTINDEKLSLQSITNGCTRRKAKRFIKNLKRMYRDVEGGSCIYKNNKNELSISLITKDDIYIGVYWWEEAQILYVNVNQE